MDKYTRDCRRQLLRSESLFRQHSPLILREYALPTGRADIDIYLWNESEKLLLLLADDGELAPKMVSSYFQELFFKANDDYRERLAAVLLIAFLTFRMLNASEEDCEKNWPLMNELRNIGEKYPRIYYNFIKKLTINDKDYDNSTVVYDHYDPLKRAAKRLADSEEGFNDTHSDDLCARISTITQPWKHLFGSTYWPLWLSFCKRICHDESLFGVLASKDSQKGKNPSGLNMKFIVAACGKFRSRMPEPLRGNNAEYALQISNEISDELAKKSFALIARKQKYADTEKLVNTLLDDVFRLSDKPSE